MMQMVVESKEVKELRHHGAGWAIHVHTEVSKKPGGLPSYQMVIAFFVILQHYAGEL